MLARLRKAQKENEGGFTLIELLVVVIIIGILAAIAIPTFLNQREKAWEKAAKSDARNAATVMEEHFSDAGTYLFSTAPALTAANFKVSDGVTLTVHGTTATTYCVQANHANLATNWKLEPAVGKPVTGDCAGAAEVTKAP